MGCCFLLFDRDYFVVLAEVGFFSFLLGGGSAAHKSPPPAPIVEATKPSAAAEPSAAPVGAGPVAKHSNPSTSAHPAGDNTMEEQMEQLRAENAALQLKVDSLTQQVSALTAEVLTHQQTIAELEATVGRSESAYANSHVDAEDSV